MSATKRAALLRQYENDKGTVDELLELDVKTQTYDDVATLDPTALYELGNTTVVVLDTVSKHWFTISALVGSQDVDVALDLEHGAELTADDDDEDDDDDDMSVHSDEETNADEAKSTADEVEIVTEASCSARELSSDEIVQLNDRKSTIEEFLGYLSVLFKYVFNERQRRSENGTFIQLALYVNR